MHCAKIGRLLALCALLCVCPSLVYGQEEADLAPSSDEQAEGEVASEKAADEGAPVRDVPPPPSAIPAAPEAPPGADKEFTQALDAYGKAHGRYAREIQDYQDTIDAIIEAEYNRRVAQINSQYDGQIRSMEIIERKHRNEAIAAFEQFLQRNPSEPRYTPDALFRLAELFFEKTNDDFMIADEQYRTDRALFEAGRIADEPVEAVRSYAQPMVLFNRLIRDWPDYRHVDGAYYLLAYCEQQMGNPDKARDLFAELIVKRPDSNFVPEAWLRIGEYHFDYAEGTGEQSITKNLELAMNAYQQAMQDEGSQFYDKALYKLAWTHYRLDDFDKAIAHFKKLVEYSDEVERRTGRSGAVLREEAVQYIAIALAEEDWDLDGARDDDYGLVRVKKYLRGEHDYEREVLVQLSGFLFDRAQYEQTIAIYEYIIANNPTHRENPLIHEKIVIALHSDSQPEAAFEVRRRLLEFYGPNSEWYAYQRRVGNDEALRYADNVVRENLIQAATWYHEEAQSLRNEALVRRDPDLLVLTQQRYRLAASAYEEFLSRYPNDKEVFQWNFYYAECLYYSGQYDVAFEQYQVVRELDLTNNEYQEISAFNAIKALEFTMRDMIQRGQLSSTALAGLDLDEARETAQSQATQRETDERQEQVGVIEAETVPPIVEKYVTAMDRYVVLRLQNPDDRYLDAKFAFQSAKVYYDFKNYDEARRRFAWIVNNYSEHEVAYLAGSLILETYREEQNYAMLAEWAERLATVIKGDQADAVRAEVREFRLGALFKSAEALYSEKKYAEAAEEYIRLVNDAPNHEYAPKALNNAAVAYELLQRYDSALRLYERVYQEYPTDPLAGYALYRVAINSERFFEFEKAIQNYTLFYDKFRGQAPKELTDMGFVVEEKRSEALKSVAVLYENLQRYDEASKSYIQFARAYPNDPQAGPGMWQAVLVYQKAGNTRQMIDTIQTYIREYGQNPENSLKVLEGMTIIADHHENSKDRRNAAIWYRTVLNEFSKRGMAPASPAAFYSGKAEFMLVEHEFDKWKALKINGNLRNQERLLKEKIAGQQKLTEQYNLVMGHRSLEWTMAANFRIGSLLQHFAAALYEVPIPFPEGSDEFDIYQERLEDIAIPLEEAAIARYEATIKRAQQDKIVNEWTKRTLDELNKFKPGEYPLYKEERRSVQKRTVTGLPYLDSEGYKTFKERVEEGDRT
ncbi:MAG: tetratricopeptide repeat protein [Bradymonadaceae bacterium]|nr:tetratricopeptide repeat protein [Lujinxingiaceae bacterium]